MILGTVQFGTNYGINNISGQPSKQSVFCMFDKAYENGVRMLDTGPMYGNAESIIGDYHTDRGCIFSVSTKFSDTYSNETAISYSDVNKIIVDSLSKLKTESIEIYYFRQYNQCKNEGLVNGLLKCRERGLIKKIGVSVYYPYELDYICNNLYEIVDVVQIPFNIFSMMVWNDSLKKAKRVGITIFARSIYLQGLAFMNPNDKFAVKSGSAKYINYVQKIARNRGSSIEQLCYDAVADNPIIIDYIVGCETEEQLEKNLQLEKKHLKLTEKELKSIEHFMSDIPLDVLDPTKWQKYK